MFWIYRNTYPRLNFSSSGMLVKTAPSSQMFSAPREKRGLVWVLSNKRPSMIQNWYPTCLLPVVFFLPFSGFGPSKANQKYSSPLRTWWGQTQAYVCRYIYGIARKIALRTDLSAFAVENYIVGLVGPNALNGKKLLVEGGRWDTSAIVIGFLLGSQTHSLSFPSELKNYSSQGRTYTFEAASLDSGLWITY